MTNQTPAQLNELNYRLMIDIAPLKEIGKDLVYNITDYVYVYTTLRDYAATQGVILTYATVNEIGNMELMFDIFRRLAVKAYLDSVQPVKLFII